jgi:hypothetical protein
MPRLKNNQTALVDLGEAPGLSVRNLIEEEVLIYVDRQLENGEWSAVVGEKRLAAGDVFDRLREDLGYEHVRVGVRGEEDVRDLVEVRP